MEEYQKRLLLRRDELQDMEGQWEPIGFGILWPSPVARVSLATWELAEDACKPYCCDRRDEHLHRLSRWLDMTPDGTLCIQWWGDEEGVEAFKGWAKKVDDVFRQHPKAAPQSFVPPVRPVPPASYFGYGPLGWKPPTGHYRTLNALSTLAVKNPHLTRTWERVILNTSETRTPVDVQVIPTRPRSLHSDDQQDEPPVKVSFLEIEEDAITLGLRSLDLLIGDATPRLNVDVPNGVIYVKGTPVTVDRLHARAVALLVEANGAWVSSNDIRKKLSLDEDNRIDRTIFKQLPRSVQDQLESQTGKGRRIRPTALEPQPPLGVGKQSAPSSRKIPSSDHSIQRRSVRGRRRQR